MGEPARLAMASRLLPLFFSYKVLDVSGRDFGQWHE